MANTLTILIDLDKIIADTSFNCRGRIDYNEVQELANDMAEKGQLQAVTVVPQEDKYKLIAGFRRYTAAQSLQWTQIECKVHEGLTESEQRYLNLGENVQRSELNIVQETRALKYFFDLGVPETTIANRLNKTRGWIQLRNMVYRLPEDVWPDIANGTISQTNVRSLYTSLLNDSREEFYENVRWIKDEKAKKPGHRNPASLADKKQKEAEKRTPTIRSVSEIRLLQDRVIKITGENTHILNKVLAWCSGVISQDDLDAAIKVWCEEQGYTYE